MFVNVLRDNIYKFLIGFKYQSLEVVHHERLSSPSHRTLRELQILLPTLQAHGKRPLLSPVAWTLHASQAERPAGGGALPALGRQGAGSPRPMSAYPFAAGEILFSCCPGPSKPYDEKRGTLCEERPCENLPHTAKNPGASSIFRDREQALRGREPASR